MDDSTSVSSPLKTSKINPSIQVIFRKIEEFYPVGVDVCVQYSISGAYEISKNDWIGLYRVGWRSHNDYVYYDWSPYPANYEAGMDVENKVNLPGSKLPADDGEFYQFCYVTSAGQVKGASTPFQFKSISVEDLIEMEDESGDMMVVKTKTSMLEERLEKANNEKMLSKQKLHLVEKELDHVYLMERNAQKKLQELMNVEKELYAALEEKNENLTEQKQQNVHLSDCINGLQDKLEVLKQEKHSIEKRLDESDVYISSLQDKIKNLVTEKDSLIGKIRNIEEDNKVLKGFLQESEQAKSRLVQEETNNLRLKREVEVMEREVENWKRQVEQHVNINKQEKHTQALLTDRLQNMENKLDASDNCKKMLNEEVLLLKQMHENATMAYDTLKVEFEGCKSSLNEEKIKNDELSNAMEVMRVGLQDCIDEHVEKVDRLTDELQIASKELEELRAQQNNNNDKHSTSEEEEGALFALSMAHQSLTERFSDVCKKLEDCKQLNSALKSDNEDLRMMKLSSDREIASLRERMVMCQEAFRDKHVECEVMERKLASLNKSVSKSRNDSFASVDSITNCADKSMFHDIEKMGDSVDDLQCEMLLLSKTQKYRNLFLNEYKKNESMRATLEAKATECQKLMEMFKALEEDDHSDFLSLDGCHGDGVANQVEAPLANKPEMTGIDIPPPSSSSSSSPSSTISCPFCDRIFSNSDKDYLADHLDTHEAGGYVCPVCQERFDVQSTERYQYIEHVQGHF